MIAHLHDREKSLEPFGWKGREAEWIALVCLHSGVFTRAQFCYFFDALSGSKAGISFCARSGGSRACRRGRSAQQAR